MKKFLWIFFLLVAVGALVYFVGYPYYLQSRANVETKVEELALEDPGKKMVALSSEGWTKTVKYVYSPRDIPSVENDFYALGYPPFLYSSDSYGQIDKSKESSHHENGMVVILTMDEKYYVNGGTLEYTVDQRRFSSTAMGDNIDPFCDFVRVITSKDVSEADRSALLREFAAVFNEKEDITKTITINDLEFKLYLDRFYSCIVMSF